MRRTIRTNQKYWILFWIRTFYLRCCPCCVHFLYLTAAQFFSTFPNVQLQSVNHVDVKRVIFPDARRVERPQGYQLCSWGANQGVRSFTVSNSDITTKRERLWQKKWNVEFRFQCIESFGRTAWFKFYELSFKSAYVQDWTQSQCRPTPPTPPLNKRLRHSSHGQSQLLRLLFKPAISFWLHFHR